MAKDPKQVGSRRGTAGVGEAYALGAKFGRAVSEAAQRLERALEANSLYHVRVESVFSELLDAFNGDWESDSVATILTGLSDRMSAERPFDIREVARWIRAHKNDAQSVLECLELSPPDELSILRILSRSGSQKVVYLANWRVAQREVVLKRFIGQDSAKKLLPRELQPHPLSMGHPNIIETHKLQNVHGEPFLVERRLAEVLDDYWQSNGIHEAANLLRDIASALGHLQTECLLHGDIKPDNIGKEDGRYILLDFGICRPEDAFAEETTPTGSIRTRAPELLLTERTHTHKSDIWALAATVFNACCGRFPLFDKGEDPPRVSRPADRRKFEESLAIRVQREWEQRVDVSEIPYPLRGILEQMLQRDVEARPEAAQVVQLAEAELSAFLRAHSDQNSFSPTEEIQQLAQFLPPRETLDLMPENERQRLASKLSELSRAKGLDEQLQGQVRRLKERLRQG